jgi:hypothetical protein
VDPAELFDGLPDGPNIPKLAIGTQFQEYSPASGVAEGGL